MRRSHIGFISSMFFAFLAIVAAMRPAAAQDMLPIFGTPEQPAETVKPATALSPQVSPSAQAVIPPAPMTARAAPEKRPAVAATEHSAPPHRHLATAAEKKKFAALMKKLASAHREVVHHATGHPVAAREPDLPPGTIIPPPGYYPPGPLYQRLVYAGPYRGWGGFRGPYPYYEHP